MGLVRGRNLIPLRAFVKETFGDKGWKEFLGAVSQRHRPLWDGLILEGSWYDRAIDIDAVDALVRLFGARQPDLLRRLASRVARHHDRLYLRPILLLGGPRMLFRRAAALYQEYYQGGTLAHVEDGDRLARLSLDDPHAPSYFCEESLPGFLEEMIRLAGRKVVAARQEKCRHRAEAPRCELFAEWR